MVNKPEITSLVDRLQQGDQMALSMLYDKYADSLYGLILKIVRKEDLAQDILQECFVNIWSKAQTYSDNKGSFFTWMLNICRNKSIDALRKENRTSEGRENYTYANAFSMRGEETNIDTIGLKDLMHRLPEEQQLILEFLYFKGYTQQETSEELNLPLGTVKTRARLAIKELQTHFVILLILWILKNT